MVSYIWRHLEVGYVQGMCDLLAPLLVILDDGESTVSSQCQCVYTWLVTQPFALTQHLWLSLLPPPPGAVTGPPEAMAFSCFTQLMKRMNHNFPHGGAMDTHFANMRSLIQVRSAVPHSVLAVVSGPSLCGVGLYVGDTPIPLYLPDSGL